MLRRVAARFVICLVAIVPAFAQGEDGTLLRLKYQAGEILRYHVVLDGAGSISVAGQQQPLSIQGTFDNLMAIEGVDPDGNYIIVSSYDNLNLAVAVNNEDLDFPLQMPKMRFLLTPAGRVVKMELLEEQQETPAGQSLESLVSSSLDLESLLSDLKCAPFPEQAVKPGEEWDGVMPVAVGGGDVAPQMKMHLRYAANEAHLGRQCVRLETTHELPFGGEGGEGGIFDIKGLERGNTVSWFDPELGRVIADESAQNLELNLDLPAGLTAGMQQVGIFVEVMVEAQTELATGED